MSEDAYTPQSPPRCIIVGGGIAGIFLGILLDRASIPYDIFERAPTVKQLGMNSIHSLSFMRIFALSYNESTYFYSTHHATEKLIPLYSPLLHSRSPLICS